MTKDELRSALVDGMARSTPGIEHRPTDLVFSFVSPGPHGMPIRPMLLSQTQSGERVYGVNRKQAQKLLGLLAG